MKSSYLVMEARSQTSSHERSEDSEEASQSAGSKKLHCTLMQEMSDRARQPGDDDAIYGWMKESVDIKRRSRVVEHSRETVT